MKFPYLSDFSQVLNPDGNDPNPFNICSQVIPKPLPFTEPIPLICHELDMKELKKRRKKRRRLPFHKLWHLSHYVKLRFSAHYRAKYYPLCFVLTAGNTSEHTIMPETWSLRSRDPCGAAKTRITLPISQ
jgi:hypothetical protein